jgi:hypothetical protein
MLVLCFSILVIEWGWEVALLFLDYVALHELVWDIGFLDYVALHCWEDIGFLGGIARGWVMGYVR